jgi:hypothetical protein
MQATTVEIRTLVTVRSAAYVERQLAATLCVRHVDVNCVAKTTAARLDQRLVPLAYLQQGITDHSLHCCSALHAVDVCNTAGHKTGGPFPDETAKHAAHACHWMRLVHARPGNALLRRRVQLGGSQRARTQDAQAVSEGTRY